VSCKSAIRRFDGDSSSTLHAAVLSRGAPVLRFVAWVTLDKGTGRYAVAADAPAVSVAWVPRDQISDETSSPAEIAAAFANLDQIPLIAEPAASRAVAWISDGGHGFPTVSIKGTPMVLVVLVESIKPGTHGQLTFGWAERSAGLN